MLSLRSELPGCRGADLHALLSALDGYEHVHFLSFGCNGALASSKSLASLLVQVLQKGFIWACDFGEVYFNEEVFDHLLSALDPRPLRPARKRKTGLEETREPSSNLAFSFADQGCGLKVHQISRLKDLTRRRRLFDKDARAVAGHPARLRNGDEVQEFDEMFLAAVSRSGILAQSWLSLHRRPTFEPAKIGWQARESIHSSLDDCNAQWQPRAGRAAESLSTRR